MRRLSSGQPPTASSRARPPRRSPREDAITREQIAAILYRYNGEAVTGDLLSSFPDADAVSGYAVEAMQWAVSRGLISGDPASDGTLWLRPRDGATRAQIAKILWVWLGA